MNRYLGTAIALGVAAASPAAGATLLVSGGQLTGATGVSVGGTAYDVSFADGSCSGLYGGCDSASDFTFTTVGDAQAAAQALLDQVLIDGGAGQFDTAYDLTFGCAANSVLTCAVLIPYATGGGVASVAQALNTAGADSSNVTASPAIAFDTSSAPNYVYALFRPSAAAVPEPASWAMMLLGFGAIGLTVRRRKATLQPA
jgi:hypothetical protein